MVNIKKGILSEQGLFNELAQLIEQSQRQVVNQANTSLIMLFWNIGSRINKDILNNKRADYAKLIVSTLSTQLEKRYGRSFELRNLRRMLQFAEQFPDIDGLALLSRNLSWSHIVELLPLKSKEAKLFYAQLSADSSLGIRDLRKQIITI